MILARLRSWLRGVLRPAQFERDMSEELQFHLEARAEDLMAQQGISREQALRQARLEFGSVEKYKEEGREARGAAFIESTLQDVRYALRVLRKNPAFTVVAVATIALMVGGVATVFALVHSVLLRPLPYPESGRLVSIVEPNPVFPGAADLPENPVSPWSFLALRDEARSFDAVAGYASRFSAPLDRETADPYLVQTMHVTPNLFPMLGIQPVMGRGFLPEDQDPASQDVVLISYEFWQQRMGGREDVLGRQIRIPQPSLVGESESVWTVVGVLPAGIELPLWTTRSVDFAAIWAPLTPLLSGTIGQPNMESPSITAIARLRPGVELEAAQAEVQAISERLAEKFTLANEPPGLAAELLVKRVVGDTGPMLWLFFGAVACVLLIGTANLTSLQAVRNAARRHEIHVRAALGAGRRRLVRQHLAETLVLSAFGCLIGILLARAGVTLVVALLPEGFPRLHEIGLDGAVALFSLAIAMLSGLLFGAIPAWQAASGIDLNRGIKEGGRQSVLYARQSRLQRSLIGIETALALVLLVGAFLLTHSLWRLFSADAGMGVWMVNIELPLRSQQPLVSEDHVRSFWIAVTEGLRALDPVESASAIFYAPPLSEDWALTLNLLPEPAVSILDSVEAVVLRGEGVSVWARPVMPDYFRMLGIPILRGRPILDSDVPGAERVVVLNESAARALFPNEDALGKLIGGNFIMTTSVRVVGIVPDFKLRLDEPAPAQLYAAFLQRPLFIPLHLGTPIVRLKPGAAGFPEAARALIASLDDRAQVTFSTMEQVRWRLVAEERFRTDILAAFALTATLLTMIGIFGVAAYSVVQRRREIGIRMALGARSSQVVWLMLRQVLLPVGVGAVVGLAGAAAFTRVLSAFLFEIHPLDPAAFIVALSCLLFAALLAGIIPARRAARVDPMIALRHE